MQNDITSSVSGFPEGGEQYKQKRTKMTVQNDASIFHLRNCR